MWVVGIIRHGDFDPLEDAPTFHEAPEARAWAQEYLRQNPDTLIPGVDVLAWHLAE